MNCYLEIAVDNNPEFTFQTSESLNQNNVHWKNFEKTFKYSCNYEELQKRFLEIRLMQVQERKQAIEGVVLAIYRVDLYTLAIGPIHSSIELNDKVITSLLMNIEWQIPRKAQLRYCL